MQAGRFRYRAKARFLDGDERERYWRMMVSFWPDFESYQKRTERLIPVVQLVASVPRLRKESDRGGTEGSKGIDRPPER